MLEENLARTAGSIGESVAAGAIFTLPAFMISRAWPAFDTPDAYWKSTVLMVVGGVLGVLFVSLMRRVMVEDPELPFPESVAAAEIHKAGQVGASAAKYLFYSMGFGAIVQLLGDFSFYLRDKDFLLQIGSLGRSNVRLGPPGSTERSACGRHHHPRRPDGQPGLHRCRLHHRAEAGVLELRRRRVCLGTDGSAAALFLWVRKCRRSSRPEPRTKQPGQRRRMPSGATSCGRSQWAACSSARLTHCSECAKACPPDSAAR